MHVKRNTTVKHEPITPSPERIKAEKREKERRQARDGRQLERGVG